MPRKLPLESITDIKRRQKEGPFGQYHYCGFWLRLLAWWIDFQICGVVILIAWILLFALVGLVLVAEALQQFSSADFYSIVESAEILQSAFFRVLLLALATPVVVFIAYGTLAEASRYLSTPGKYAEEPTIWAIISSVVANGNWLAWW